MKLQADKICAEVSFSIKLQADKIRKTSQESASNKAAG